MKTRALPHGLRQIPCFGEHHPRLERSFALSYTNNMKTIAVTIDEATLQILDELAEASPQPQSRSALVRVAIREFATQARRRESEAREHQILHKHRKRLAQQTRALIAEQAQP